MTYGVSNVHVIYDETWPQKVKLVSSKQLESANSWICFLETIA